MKTIKQIATRPYLILLLSVFVVVAFSALRLGSSRARASRQLEMPPLVRSLVPNFKVVDVQVQNSAVSLSLRNDYNKTITAFAVSSSRIITRTDLIYTDEVIPPGATKSGLYELPPSPLPEYAITLQAAVFDDETAEGNARIIKQILDARAGQREQTTRILPSLQNTLNASKGDLKQQWQKIKFKFGELPSQEEGKSFEFNAALQDAKNLAIGKINELEQIQQERGEDVARQRLAHIKELYEGRSTKLRGSLNGSQ